MNNKKKGVRMTMYPDKEYKEKYPDFGEVLKGRRMTLKAPKEPTMRKVFGDEDEKIYFCKYLAQELNHRLDDIADELAIHPVILVESEWIDDIISHYEK